MPGALVRGRAPGQRDWRPARLDPARAGERGAIEAGALPNLLPAAGRIGTAAVSAEVARVWATVAAGRPGPAPARSSPPRPAGNRRAGHRGVDPADLPDPAAALAALEPTPFVVSLELRVSAVTDRADVVFPVAAVAEKTGTFVNWEGRGRSFAEALPVPGLRTDL